MPELPDIQLFKQYIDATALHQTIKDVQVFQTRILDGVSKSNFARAVTGKSMLSTDRYGKHLFIKTGGPTIRMHFGMTGFLKYYKGREDLRYVRLVFNFTRDYKLAYLCQRMLGRISLEDSIDDYIKRHDLGPDALAIGLGAFKEAAQNSRQAAKSFLMDQTKIAGIGNIYSDEILFQSGIHPKSSTRDLDESAIKTIHKNIRKVCVYAVKHKADPDQFAKSYLLSRREKGAACPKCNGSLRQTKISGRTAYFCPNCQKT